MPKGMGKLKQLHTLSNFVVGKQDDNGMEELGGLINLRGSLKIQKLENVVDGNEARRARIIDKKHVDEVLLEWSLSSGDDMVSNTHTDEEDVLQGLQPHRVLKVLRIKGYKGKMSPEGGLPPNLKQLSVGGCKEQVRGVSWLGNLDNLTHLMILGDGRESRIKSYPELHILSYYIVGKSEENGIQELGGLLNLHASLEIRKLENVVDANEARNARIIDKKHIEELLLKWSSGDDMVSNTHSDEQDILQGLQPHRVLKVLEIDGYKESLDIRGCPNICRLPEGGLPPNLKELSVGDCEQQLRGVSWLGNLDNLTRLTISGKSEDNGIQELGGLLNLRASLQIWKLENVVDANQARNARIIDKKHIEYLILKWSSGDDMVSNTHTDGQDILHALQPHHVLKKC
ncbi:hypothetical protein AHAS_Ahas02G0020600 [Arachis hypogaea]